MKQLERRSKSVLIYGGSRGVGNLIAEHLGAKGLDVLVIARNSAPPASNVTSVELDISTLEGQIKNHEILTQHKELKLVFFNIGGSFGIHQRIPTSDNFMSIFERNFLYVLTTIKFLHDSNSLSQKVLGFMLTNALRTKNSNIAYLISKLAVEEYANYLSQPIKHNPKGVLKFYPPLILYPGRYLADSYLSQTTLHERQKFVETELGGEWPVTPEELAAEIAEQLIAAVREERQPKG